MNKYEVHSVERPAAYGSNTRWYATIRDNSTGENAAQGAGVTRGEAIDTAWNELASRKDRAAEHIYDDWQRCLKTIGQQGSEIGRLKDEVSRLKDEAAFLSDCWDEGQERIDLLNGEYKTLSDDYDRLAKRNDQMHTSVTAAMHLIDTLDGALDQQGLTLIISVIANMLAAALRTPQTPDHDADIPF